MCAFFLAFLVALSVGLTASPPVSAQERIIDFSSDIAIAANGSLTVRETITVQAENNAIVHGIFRDFPTTHIDRAGNRSRVRFDVREVLRDGQPEPYLLQSIENGKRVHIGYQDAVVPRGRHTYLIVYQTARQIEFFPDFDGLYWNVTGNGWTFPILHAEAIVHLPESAAIKRSATYTGPQGSGGNNASSQQRAGSIRLFTTKALNQHEGLTFALGFSKGAVTPPREVLQVPSWLLDNAAVSWLRDNPALKWLRNNAALASAGFGLFALCVYFLVVWWRVGRDPARGVIVPLFAPPEDRSPASLRYIRKMGYDGKCFAAALINMAVKGYLTIAHDHWTYNLTLTGKLAREVHLSHAEAAAANALFAGRDTIALDRSESEHVQKAIEFLQAGLKREDEGQYFVTNRRWFFGGFAILFVSTAATAYFTGSSDGMFVLFAGIFLWTSILVALFRWTGTTYRGIYAMIGPRLIMGTVLLLFSAFQSLSIDASYPGVLNGLAAGVPAGAVAALLGQGALAFIFFYLLKARTLAGAKIRDEIDGFRMFLTIAEKDRLEALHPPHVTPDVFEKFLPYAIALDAENAWSKKFEAQAEAAGQTANLDTFRWYSGRHASIFGNSFASDLGSSLSSVASRVGAPSVSGGLSAGGGGGSSGGGGGGGGGGGW